MVTCYKYLTLGSFGFLFFSWDGFLCLALPSHRNRPQKSTFLTGSQWTSKTVTGKSKLIHWSINLDSYSSGIRLKSNANQNLFPIFLIYDLWRRCVTHIFTWYSRAKIVIWYTDYSKKNSFPLISIIWTWLYQKFSSGKQNIKNWERF